MLIDHNIFLRLNRSREYLADSAVQAITVEQAAAKAHMSLYHFIRQFQRAFGQTPYQFLQHRRIEIAKHLLASTDLPVTDICFETGYESLGSFSALFRHSTALTPSAFRKQTGRIFAIRWAAGPVYIPSCFLAHYGLDLTLVQEQQFSRSANSALSGKLSL